MIDRITLLQTITKLAGIKLLGYYDKASVVSKKGETDFALEADLEVEKIIINRIRDTYRDDSILAEEAGSISGNTDYLWVIDPLDGTANFKAKIPYFCTTIGLEKSGVMTAAAVYDPIKDELFFAEKSKGAFCNNKRISVSNSSEPRQFLISYSTSNHKDTQTIDQGSKLFQIFLHECRAIRLQGSSILDLCGLARGTFDGLVKVGANYWDFAPGCLIVEEAGGIATDLSGQNWSKDSVNIFASNKIRHKEILEVIKVVK